MVLFFLIIYSQICILVFRIYFRGFRINIHYEIHFSRISLYADHNLYYYTYTPCRIDSFTFVLNPSWLGAVLQPRAMEPLSPASRTINYDKLFYDISFATTTTTTYNVRLKDNTIHISIINSLSNHTSTLTYYIVCVLTLYNIIYIQVYIHKYINIIYT